MSEFLSMNGYGLYVWSAYGICFIVLGALILHTVYSRKKLKSLLAQLKESE
ncbi:MAG: heme exporter protein CcmD [Alphaproteobacteria bacterium]|nr:heme exporter protein CcmD [Alphaproteobacteria bacterium]